MSKYGPRILVGIVIVAWCIGFGVLWTAIGSKGDSYTIEFMDNGFTCNCPAFTKCKHINQIEQNFIGEDK
jgi:hypothetical protein